jgi:opacity protein-like surface antigen
MNKGSTLDGGIGAGYYINNKYRLSLQYNMTHIKQNVKYRDFEEVLDESTTTGVKKIEYKTDIDYVLLNNYLNIVDKENYSLFVSGGIGYATINEKINALFSGNIINGETINIPLAAEQYKTKRTNFIYGLGAGVGIKVNETINLDINYNYKNFGKPKRIYNLKTASQVKKYYTHQVGFGLRVNL